MTGLPLVALDVSPKAVGVFGPSLCGFTWRPPSRDLPVGYTGFAFQKFLYRFAEENGVEMYVYEAPHVGGSGGGIIMNENTTIALIGMAFSVEVIGASLRIPVKRGHVGTWRKHFLGHGRPENPKQAALDRCRLLGWKVDGVDAAEAAGLFAWAKGKFDPAFRLETTPLLGRSAA